VSLLLAGSLCLFPFLLPYHEAPILSFQAEWLSAVIGIAAMLAALTNGRERALIAMPLPARWLMAFALLLAVQALLGNPVYPQLPISGAIYVLYAALMMWLGAQFTNPAGFERAASLLAACLLAGALANAAAGMIQFYGRPMLLGGFLAELHRKPFHNGAYGNIGQSNLYSNYLALGATALLFLWQRQGLRSAYALAAALLLAWAGALSGSRSTLLYAFWFALLAKLSARIPAGAGSRPLTVAAYGAASFIVVAQFAVPWLNGVLHLGPESKGAFERLVAISGSHTEARGQAWMMALRVFADAPAFGTGAGEFAGAAFETGLPPEMEGGEVWTSPHNLPLHLLAETGASGAFLALAGLCIWCWQAAQRYVRAPQPALWWIIAAVGIELIHSMFEFPLWYAHFLGATALLMGLGAGSGAHTEAASRPSHALAAALCAALALTLGIVLRDYLLLDATRAAGTSLTLANPADSARDAAVMHDLTLGPLAPIAELWMFLGVPLNRDTLAARLEMSARVARYFPSNTVVVRRAAFLAFDGQAAAAQDQLQKALRSFPHRCQASVSILEQALAADPGAIRPLLATVKNTPALDCIALPGLNSGIAVSP
jgi:hypothetical protein